MLFVGVLKCLSLPCFLFVRRKILRLYWGGFAICLGNEMPFVAALFVRETQDFASLQADAIVVTDGKLHDGMRSKLK
jgi:hypothetical protein